MTLEERVERLERMVQLVLEGIKLLHRDHEVIESKLDDSVETRH